MGSFISSLLFQPLLLGTAVALIIIGLRFRDKKCKNDKDDSDAAWGKEIFKINLGIACAIVIAAILINFISAFEI